MTRYPLSDHLDGWTKEAAPEMVPREPLTPLEWRVVMACVEPNLCRATARKKADLLGVSRRSLFRCLARPHVKRALAAAMQASLLERVGQVADALLTSASMPGREGTADRRLFFQVLGQLGTAINQPATQPPPPNTVDAAG